MPAIITNKDIYDPSCNPFEGIAEQLSEIDTIISNQKLEVFKLKKVHKCDFCGTELQTNKIRCSSCGAPR